MRNRGGLYSFFGFFAPALLFAQAVCVHAFDWPQSVESSESFGGFFGEPRGGTVSSSVIFSDSAPVRAAEDGTIIACLKDAADDMGWFPSPLGNAVIIAHEGGLLSVYANLEAVSCAKDGSPAARHDEIGVSGASGWHEPNCALEFQISDLKNKAAVNPLVFMPKSVHYEKIPARGLRLINKKNAVLNPAEHKIIPAGTYTLCRAVSENMPLKTAVAVNGAAVETVSYDMLSVARGKRVVAGAALHPFERIYKNGMQYLAEVTLNSGYSIITVILTDISGSEETSSLSLTVR
ncbi:MAG: M23 family metallopeptidase [Bacteroides sp.]|nr:M23 family metallopeptidase [Prevotella sp.]MCM1406849.1 M23 family metallopeptidase [Treponema brennaborense]MCM1470822.1 M23 family metallopeptidase [Bacteroides sp.]